MNNLLCSASQMLTPPPIKVGQAHFDTPGTYQWTCPPGVSKVCVAVVGSGGCGVPAAGSGRRSGDGGNLRYKNHIAVTPGQVYNITVGNSIVGSHLSQSSGGLGLTSVTAIDDDVKGENGGIGGSASTLALRKGGNAGGKQALARGGLGINLRNWSTVTPVGDYGFASAGGGGSVYQNGLNPKYGRGAPGAVRIIWGDNRAFPNQNTGDM